MKATGMVRRIDDLGRIVLPKEMRRSLGLKEGTPIEIFISRDEIVLKKYYPEKRITELTQELMEAVGEQGADLEPGLSEEIKKKVQEIQKLLCTKTNVDHNYRYECPVCKNERLKSGQQYCQICGTLLDLQADADISE